MASDYASIQADNLREYGAGVGRWGPKVLAHRYDDRTHFIFELLQNAEDAMARRQTWLGPRSVNFELSPTQVRVTHFGEPFTEANVRGICGIDESTKDLTAIGRFGIGFKSVYAFTERPEVHSGAEDFAIESFVWPTAVPPVERGDDETIIVLPLKPEDDAARDEIARGLQRLDRSTLLFLRQIEEIAWSVEGGPSGLYMRTKPDAIYANVRRITVIGQEEGKSDTEEDWLVFSREVTTDDGTPIGHAEIAFSIVKDDESKRETVRPVQSSPLVVFFPTVLTTHLGFLVQGPYRTTPSRDNVPRDDRWNQYLVRQTATLLVEALHWLREHDLLTTAVLRCLPLDPTKFSEGAMLAPLFDATKQALTSQPLLPRFDAGHAPATHARLSRTQELRDLIAPNQLAALLGHEGELAWLNGDITLDRTPELRRYLTQELGIAEVTPEIIIPRLDKLFLQAQPDAWILDLYHFLNGQQALRRRFSELPLIRLEDGTHVVAHLNGQPQAFLPGEIKTDFPTVRAAVCASDAAREFLQLVGLTEPDLVDDVVWNVLPKYQADEVDVSDADYESDIRRILKAFATDSKGQREKLLAALRETDFVRAVDAGHASQLVSKPGELYFATERLNALFAGVAGVILVDDTYPCLRGEDVRELLEACGATRYLQPVSVVPDFSWQQLRDMRIAAGYENMSTAESLEDHTLRGLDSLLKLLPTLNESARANRAALLWEALSDVQDRRGTGSFSGTYRWLYHQRRNTAFDAAFVWKLNATAWVPDADGELQRPEFVVFDALGWKPNPFLQSKILFKPPIIETLAREAGIEPGVLDLLKKHGVTSVAELMAWLGLEPEPKQAEGGPGPMSVTEALKNLLGNAQAPTPAVPNPPDSEPRGSGNGDNRRGGTGTGGGTGSPGTGGSPEGRGGGRTGSGESHASGTGKRRPGSAGGRPFISYVGVAPDDKEPDPDGLDQAARMELEEKAIAVILADEPQLQRTPMHNPGFDLFEPGDNGQPTRWVEVKAMAGGLHDRPVGVSRTQFEHAQKHGEAYWLYVVEHAGDDGARVVPIQDPAGKARTFTFDHGWLGVAKMDTEQQDQEG